MNRLTTSFLVAVKWPQVISAGDFSWYPAGRMADKYDMPVLKHLVKNFLDGKQIIMQFPGFAMHLEVAFLVESNSCLQYAKDEIIALVQTAKSSEDDNKR